MPPEVCAESTLSHRGLTMGCPNDTLQRAHARYGPGVFRFMVAGLGIAFLLGATFSPEGAVDAPEALQRGPAYQGGPSLVALDGGFFSAWYDGRSGVASIYGTHVFPDGGVASLSGRELTPGMGDVPRVACSAKQCLVTWMYIAPGDWLVGQQILARTLAVRVGLDQTPIDAQPLELGPRSQVQGNFHPAVASDGTDFVVLAPRFISGQARFDVVVVTETGAVVPRGTIPLLDGETGQWLPSISWSGNGYVAAWNERGAGGELLRIERLSASGALEADAGVTVPLTGGAVSETVSACGQASCLVAWAHESTGAGFGIRVAPDSTLLDAQPLQLGTAFPYSPTLSATSEDPAHLLAHSTSTGVAVLRIEAGGAVSSVGLPELADATMSRPAIASGGGRALLAFTARSGMDVNVGLSWLSSDGTGFEPPAHDLPRLGPSQSQPLVERVEGGHLLVWRDWRDGESDLRIAHVDSKGDLTPPEGRPLGVGAISPRVVDIGRCGEEVLLVWDTSTPSPMVQVLRVAQDGTPLSAPITVGQHTQGVQGPTVSASEDVCLVAWSEYSQFWNTYAVRFAVDGGLLDEARFPIATGSGPQYLPASAWDGEAFLIAWAHGAVGPITSINGMRLFPDGGVAHPEVPLVETPNVQVSVACERANCLLLWTDESGSEPELRVGRLDLPNLSVSPDGGVPIAAIPTSVNSSVARLTVAGDEFQAVWATPVDGGVALKLARIDPLGPTVRAILDVPSEAARLDAPAIAGAPGETLLAYTAIPPPPHDGTRRVKVRFFRDLPLGAACTESGECNSGHCSNGVCCDSTCDDERPVDPPPDPAVDPPADPPVVEFAPRSLAVGCSCAATKSANGWAVFPLLTWAAVLQQAARRRARLSASQ